MRKRRIWRRRGGLQVCCMRGVLQRRRRREELIVARMGYGYGRFAGSTNDGGGGDGVCRSGIDFLAPAFRNVHGSYGGLRILS